jgi:perosamine synthetase
MDEHIPLFEIPYAEGELENVIESVTRGGYWTKGPYVERFERGLEEYMGVKHAVAVNSGTSALLCGLHGLGVGPGDEVIVPSFTFIATANAVRITGAEPVFADIERETYGLNPNDVRAKLSEDTAAIVPVHPFGGGCDIQSIVGVADERSIPVLEDAAGVIGAAVDGRKLGTFGEVGAVSFCQNKVVTSGGEGGAVLTDDSEVARRAELFRSHGRVQPDHEASYGSTETGTYVSLGMNLRLADPLAAIGCAQLARVESLIQRRRSVAAEYDDQFAGIASVDPHDIPGRHVYQLYTVTLPNESVRDTVSAELADRGIDSKVYWSPPVHETEFYRSSNSVVPDLPVTAEVSSRVLSLPMHPNLSTEAVEQVVKGVRRGLAAGSEGEVVSET